MDILQKESYIDESRNYFSFLLEARQWSGFGSKELNQWIKNFGAIEDGEYIACRILNELLAYSEEDIVQMFIGAFSDVLHKEILLPKQIESGFSCLKSDLDFELNNALRRTLFVPLSVNGAPGESGAEMIRLLTKKSGLGMTRQFHSDINDDCECDRIIILDDCIGSGEQFRDFWNGARIKSERLFREWCVEKGVRIYYIVLVGTETAVKELKEEYDEVEFVCVEVLKESHSVIESIQQDEIFTLHQNELEKYLEELNINLKGFADLTYAVALHGNIPDWSLPVFHKEREQWKPLIRRKDSNE